MKAQTQALTTVLITTVIIGAAASTYVWGQPLLDKQQSQTQVEKLEREAVNIYSLGTSVARSGSGHRSKLDISLNQGTLDVNDQENYIQIKVPTDNSPYASRWTLLKGNVKRNTSVQGGDFASEGSTPGVLAVKTNPSSAKDTVTYRIEFRNVRADDSLKRIELEPVGRKTGTGDFTLSLTNKGKETDSSYEISTGETFELTKTVVEVDIQ